MGNPNFRGYLISRLQANSEIRKKIDAREKLVFYSILNSHNVSAIITVP